MHTSKLSKITPDGTGRYLILQGSVTDVNINLVNLHRRNADNPKSSVSFLSSMSGYLLIGEDFNTTLSINHNRLTVRVWTILLHNVGKPYTILCKT